MKNKPKLAFIDVSNFSNWPIGGMLEYELAILKNLVNYYDIDLWGVSVDGIDPQPIEINNQIYKINVYANVKTKNKIIPNFWKGLAIYFNRCFRKKKYDVIYGHSGSCMYAAIKASCSAKTVFAYHQHGLSYLNNKSLMSLTQKPFYYLSQRLSDVVFLVTDPDSAINFSKKMECRSAAKFVGIGSPIDISKFNYPIIHQRIEQNKNVPLTKLIYVGRLSPEKNVVDMVFSLKEYINKTKNDSIVLNLVGDGPSRVTIEKAIKKMNLEKNVRLSGSVCHSNVYQHLLEADAFLITSNGEGVSIAVLEAFASGLPVVCYDVPGLGKQNKNGITGIVVSKKDYRSFADGIVEVGMNKYDMSYNCIAESKKYASEEIVKSIYNEIKSAKIRKENHND